MDRFDRQPAVSDDAGPAERLKRANDEISQLRARISTLEQTLETESRIRVEAGAMLASERMRTCQLEEQLATQEQASGPAPGDLEAAPREPPHSPQAAPEGGTRRWWQRPDSS